MTTSLSPKAMHLSGLLHLVHCILKEWVLHLFRDFCQRTRDNGVCQNSFTECGTRIRMTELRECSKRHFTVACRCDGLPDWDSLQHIVHFYPAVLTVNGSCYLNGSCLHLYWHTVVCCHHVHYMWNVICISIGGQKKMHVCHIEGCNKVYGKTSHLRAHLR